MAHERILVVDQSDEPSALLGYDLIRAGYEVDCVASGQEALADVRQSVPDLIVLDALSPSVDGLEICRTLRNDDCTANIPILMLSAKCEESDIVSGLELGADDYITKPFSPRVLLAHIRALLRRSRRRGSLEEKATVRIHEIFIEPSRHDALLNGKPGNLTDTEFRLLSVLARKPGWAFTRAQIVDEMKGEDGRITERMVGVHVAGLRKKLGPYAHYLETVRGVGYRFKE